MTTMELIGQGFGILGMISYILSFQAKKNYLYSVHGKDTSETYQRHTNDEKWRTPERIRDGRYIIRFLLDHGVEEDKDEFMKQFGPYKKIVECVDLKDYLCHNL